ncbi:MAG TPA: hypothetical protein VMY39_00690 [Planctomycetota bacterium]|nr:hypothetical protein [Planctomycetota bacterium]
MAVSVKDRDTLRELGKRVADIAALPVQKEKIALWKALNALKPVRPMVTVDQVCWNEMDVDGGLTLRCRDDFFRQVESRMRRTLYSWKRMPVDRVVEGVIDIPKVIRGGGFGIDTIEQVAVTDPENAVVAHAYEDQLRTEEDVERIRAREVFLDKEATARREVQAQEIFDGILQVRMQGWFPVFAPWDRIVTWRGPENMLLDLAMRPAFMHRIISRLTDAHLDQLDQLEEKGLLGHSQALIHCTGAWTDELPAPGFDPDRPRAKDLWTFGMSQIFSTVGPATHKEFELDYANRWHERFGLVYYGCCEPLDGKIDVIRGTPHVRKISMSPWVNVEKGAERIGSDFVFSRKPNPAFLATESWDGDLVERDLRETVEVCRRHGCPVELILKDISTVRYQPQRLWEWAKIAMRVVEET